MTQDDFSTSKCVATSRKLAPPANLHKAIVTRLAGGIAFRSLVFLLEISGETRLTNRRDVSHPEVFLPIVGLALVLRHQLKPPKAWTTKYPGRLVGILCRDIYATFKSAKLVDVAVGRVCDNKPCCRNKNNLLLLRLIAIIPSIATQSI